MLNTVPNFNKKQEKNCYVESTTYEQFSYQFWTLKLTYLSHKSHDRDRSKNSLRRKIQLGYIIQYRQYSRRKSVAFGIDLKNAGLSCRDVLKMEVAERARTRITHRAGRIGQRNDRVCQPSAFGS